MSGQYYSVGSLFSLVSMFFFCFFFQQKCFYVRFSVVCLIFIYLSDGIFQICNCSKTVLCQSQVTKHKSQRGAVKNKDKYKNQSNRNRTGLTST